MCASIDDDPMQFSRTGTSKFLTRKIRTAYYWNNYTDRFNVTPNFSRKNKFISLIKKRI